MKLADITLDQKSRTTRADLAQRVLAGEVYVARGGLQSLGVMDRMVAASLKGIARSVGQDAADDASREGFQHIHHRVAPGDVPKMTDAVYEEITPIAPELLRTIMQGMFPGIRNFYFEEKPNVRFHIPYDLARAHQNEFKNFAKQHGQGKISAHGPHRDSWFDCPSNGIKLWFAIGRIRPGNGMTIYPDDYGGNFRWQSTNDIADGEKLHRSWAFDMQPGDGLLFHTDHVPGSELNRTDQTRFAISFRVSVERPVFPNLHFHPYIHAGWHDSGLLRPIAQLPAMAQPSYVRSFAARLRNKAFPAMTPAEPGARLPEAIGHPVGAAEGMIEVPLAEVPVGTVRGVTPALCVARLSETEAVALTRRCPHAGGDLANGWVMEGTVVCPWHNLPFDAETGRSACTSLPALRRVACEIREGRILIDPAVVLNRPEREPGVEAAE